MLLIRVDASALIGMGHLLRCLAIAEYFGSQGIEVTFLSKPLPLDSLAFQRKFNFVLLPEVITIEEELEIIQRIDKENKIDAIVLDVNNFHSFDSAALYKHYLNSLKLLNFILISFEDPKNGIDRADIIVLPYLGSRKFSTQQNPNARYLLGLEYYILRPEFVEGKSIEIKEVAKNVLITMGGADPQNITTKVLSALNEFNLNLTIVIGNLYSENESTIDHTLRHFKGTYSVLKNVENMAKIMVNSDIAIINSGLTKYETLSVGLPSIVISNNDYHLELMNDFNDLNVLVNLGVVDELSNDHISNAVTSLANNYTLRQQMSASGQLLIDGQGTKRIFNEIQNRIRQN